MNLLKKKYLQIYFLIRILGSNLLRSIQLARLKAEWLIKNPNNNTFPVKYFPIDLVAVGDYSYGPIDVYTYCAKGEGLEIGKFCSIAKDVKFILGGNHRIDCLMTFPIINKFGGENENESITKGKIVIENDVWIGVGATILSGVTIGHGCVVAAGAIITKSFPPFSVIGGNPAKIIKMRFDETTILELERSEFEIGSIKPELIINNIELFEMSINEVTIQSIMQRLNNK